MSLKPRLRQLRDKVDWLKTWGALRGVELQFEILAKQRAIEEALGAKKAASRPVPRPTPVSAPVPAPMPVRPRAEAPPAAPRAPPAEPPEEPVVQPFNYDPPEHMQIRPVRWRQRGPQDWQDDSEDMVGKCLTEYDPLAGIDDDAYD